MAWLCPKHPRIVAGGLQFAHHNSLVIGMRGIDQVIVLIGGENRGHQQQTMLAVLRKFISESRELGRCCGFPPVCRQVADFKLLSGQIIRNFRNRQHEITGRIVLIKMDKILQHGERLMFRCVAEADSRTRPPPAVPVRSLAIEGAASVGPAQDSVNSAQLIPPKAMRPKMFSTWRAPNSVSIADTGAIPPRTRLGCLSQRIARS